MKKYSGSFVFSILGILSVVVALVAIIISWAASGELTLAPNYSPTNGGTSVTITRNPNWSNQFIDFGFTGAEQTFTAPVTGRYKLEVWGSQGGDPGNGQGGKGGYTTAEVTLTAGQTVYIHNGGTGNVNAGGYNGGGGAANGGIGGGGASHMALSPGLLSSFNSNRGQLLVVAGGGGGSIMTNVAGCFGGVGGGASGKAGVCPGFSANGGGGTQTSVGAAGNNGTAGSFGAGGASTQKGGSDYGGGGGGGFYGGGGSSGRGGGGGGGSGYFQTANINSAAVTNGATLAGDTNFADPDRTTVTGHAGTGYARVTILTEGIYYNPKVYVGGVEVNPNNVSFVATDLNSGEQGSITFVSPAHDAGIADVTVDFELDSVGELHYWAPASSYINECTVDGGATWDNVQYVDADTPVTCRVVLNNSFDGTISLSDDYYQTIDPSLSGDISSDDPRFDAETKSFTVSRGDTLDERGQTLYYTYTSPTWNEIRSHWKDDGSNRDDLFWPGIEVNVTSKDSANTIVRDGEPSYFGIWAKEYDIIPEGDLFATGFRTMFTITTYGAPYGGTIAINENLSNSDDPNGEPGSFEPSPAVFDFADLDGADMEFYYTPETTGYAPNYVELCGVSSVEPVADTCVELNVISPVMYLTGATELARGETGSYTLTVDPDQVSNGFGGYVTLSDVFGDQPAGGIFTDTSTGQTFDPSTKTYFFDINNPAETYVRTFNYTVPSDDDANTSVRLAATADNDDYTFANVAITANRILFRCSPGYPDCHVAYVNESKDYIIQANGTFTGSAELLSTAGGNFDIGNNLSWAGASIAYSSSYIPQNTGRHYFSATASSSVNQEMDGKTFASNDSGSFGYLWVIANQMSVVGDDSIANAGTGHFTLTLNGPYEGNVYLSDIMDGVNQGGSFSNGGVCEFTFADYDMNTNRTSCTFSYTPTVVAQNRNITITPSMPSDYVHTMISSSFNTLAHGYPKINTISPSSGVSSGGETVTITGTNLNAVSIVLFDGLVCANLTIISDTIMSCQTPAHGAATVNVATGGNAADTLSYTYFNVATDYRNECYVDGEWMTEPYVNPGTAVDCRIVILNGRFQGQVSLSDDYYDTVDENLFGTIASSDQRFIGDDATGEYYFNLGHSDMDADTGQVLNYTYTSPSWETLKSFYKDDGSTDDDLFWPLLEVDVLTSAGDAIVSSSDNVVFGLYAQEYYIAPDSMGGNYDYYCVDCEVDMLISTYGAPYEGTIYFSDDISNSDNPSGEHGVFLMGDSSTNPASIDFTGTDGASVAFGYIPATTAENDGKFIRLYGYNSDPSMVNEAHYDLSPVLNPGIFIIPHNGYNFLSRNETGTYTLRVTISGDWGGEVSLSDIFNVDSSSARGVFADASSGSDPTGTFNPATNTYTFTAGASETYERTFTYTLRDDYANGPHFPSYLMRLVAKANSSDNESFTSILINADRLMINCAASYPDCNVGYVGVLKDYAFTPNGGMMGQAIASGTDVGEISTLIWPTISAASQVRSYTPTSPGVKSLTALVTESNVDSMENQTYSSTDVDSMDDYIWVMADSMSISGPSWLKSGAAGSFSLTMNGPFIGKVNLYDTNMGALAGGAFSNGGYCEFNLDDYDFATNTTSCSFTYEPLIYDDMTTISLTPSVENYSYPMSDRSLDVLVYGKPIITSISPENGPTTGGNTIMLTGDNLAQGSVLGVDSVVIGNISINLDDITIIDNNNISFIAPHNTAGGVDIVVTVSDKVYHHPGIYTYVPVLNGITPSIGPTSGGTGFGADYNESGEVTITGDGITPVQYYSDGTEEYFGIEYLQFDGTQYINTGVNQLGNTKATLNATRDSGMYAAGILVPNNYFMIALSNSGYMIPAGFYGNASSNAGGGMASGDKISATLDANGTMANFSVALNGGTTHTNSINPSVAPSTGYDIFLGRVNNGSGVTRGIVGKVYSFVIDKDGVANDRNLIPVCSSVNKVGGMFDTLHNVFYPSQTTPFSCDYSSIASPEVKFGNITVPADNITVIDSETITVIPPAHEEEVVDVSVVVNGVTATLENSYTYRAPLTIHAVSPSHGPPEGGTVLTITGHNFVFPEELVSGDLSLSVVLDIGGTPAECRILNPATDVSNDTIVCITTEHPEGIVSVTVDNGIESATMEAQDDGNGIPIKDEQGRSIGGFLYGEETYLSIRTTSRSVGLNVSISSPYDEEESQIGVATNNPTGYSLSMLSSGPDLVCEVDNSHKITSTSGNSIDPGAWGYQVGLLNPNGWSPVPVDSPFMIASSSSATYAPPNPIAYEDTNVGFAVRDRDDTPLNACSKYAQDITYTAIANI